MLNVIFTDRLQVSEERASQAEAGLVKAVEDIHRLRSVTVYLYIQYCYTVICNACLRSDDFA